MRSLRPAFTALMALGVGACVIGEPYANGTVRELLGSVLGVAWVVSFLSLRAATLGTGVLMPFLAVFPRIERAMSCSCHHPPPEAEHFGLLAVSLSLGALVICSLASTSRAPELPPARIEP